METRTGEAAEGRMWTNSGPTSVPIEPGRLGPAEPVARLFIGWIFFIGTVIPEVSVDLGGVATFIVCLALSAFLGHVFCRWLWKNSGHEEPWKRRWTATGMSVIVLMFAAGMAFTGVVHQTGWLLRSPRPMFVSSGSMERNSSASLKTIVTAQADFRANDRDGNGVADYWRGDIAGLYVLKPQGSEPPDLYRTAARESPGAGRSRRRASGGNLAQDHAGERWQSTIPHARIQRESGDTGG